MPARYAPALLLDVFAFWFVLRWLLTAAAVLLRLLVGMMVVGMLGTLDQHHYVWAATFAGSALLASYLLHRWRGARPRRETRRLPLPTPSAWRHVQPTELATLCEQRLGLQVDAAVPVTIESSPEVHCVLALAGDGLWALADESLAARPQIGRVLACWARCGLVAHMEHSRRRERLEFSWPGHGALVRGITSSGAIADTFAGHLIADEFLQRT